MPASRLDIAAKLVGETKIEGGDPTGVSLSAQIAEQLRITCQFPNDVVADGHALDDFFMVIGALRILRIIELHHRAQIPASRELDRQRKNYSALHCAIAEIVLVGRELDEWHHAERGAAAIIATQIRFAPKKDIAEAQGARPVVRIAIMRPLDIVVWATI